MPWRVGKKVPINVYDADGNPVCQCHNAAYAGLIVRAVNEYNGAQPSPFDDFVPPRGANAKEHVFMASRLNKFCDDCGAGWLHPIHIPAAGQSR